MVNDGIVLPLNGQVKTVNFKAHRGGGNWRRTALVECYLRISLRFRSHRYLGLRDIGSYQNIVPSSALGYSKGDLALLSPEPNSAVVAVRPGRKGASSQGQTWIA